MNSRIVGFAKDWDDVPTCITHVLRGMGRTLPVLWVNSIGTRRPNLASGRDVGRLADRLGGVGRGAVRKENGLWVLSPLLIPRAKTRLSAGINRFLFRVQMRRAFRQMQRSPSGFSLPPSSFSLEYWCSVPNAVDLLPAEREIRNPQSAIRNSRTVYYCVDDWDLFPGVDGPWLGRKEKEMLARADVVFTPAKFLVEKCRAILRDNGLANAQGKVHLAPHGVEYERFARALDPALRVPEDIAGLPKPVIGFYGNLHPWVDFALIEALAAGRPQWSFVLIGRIYSDVSSLRRLPNVRLLGRREHADLPAYCKGFDAAMIPYDMRDPRMESVNPVKTKELLAAGVPVVASRLPELAAYGEDVLTCGTAAPEWGEALERQIARRDRPEISARVRDEDWSAKVEEMRRIVDARVV